MGLAQIANVVKDPASILGLLLGTDTLIDDITLDVMIEEQPEFRWSITDKAVEAGLNIAENRVKESDTLVLEGLQTDDQLELSVSGVTSLLDGIQTWGDKYDRLLELANQDKIFDVQTPSRLHQDMAIQSFRPNITKEKSTALWFRIEFKQMRVVNTETSTVDEALVDALIAEGAPPQAKTETRRNFKGSSKGKKSGVDPTERQQSLALQGLIGTGLVSQ